VFYISTWGVWKFVGGAKPTKASRGDGTGYMVRERLGTSGLVCLKRLTLEKGTI